MLLAFFIPYDDTHTHYKRHCILNLFSLCLKLVLLFYIKFDKMHVRARLCLSELITTYAYKYMRDS